MSGVMAARGSDPPLRQEIYKDQHTIAREQFSALRIGRSVRGVGMCEGGFRCSPVCRQKRGACRRSRKNVRVASGRRASVARSAAGPTGTARWEKREGGNPPRQVPWVASRAGAELMGVGASNSRWKWPRPRAVLLCRLASRWIGRRSLGLVCRLGGQDHPGARHREPVAASYFDFTIQSRPAWSGWWARIVVAARFGLTAAPIW